ncbi:hypothetical protein NKR23_g180 [Pleurostoma richardsiae]|uniref:Methyltransferase n=1 Tax=Pleurostoma richardsiae TaxID=41990 RepID=A0AA38RUI5_9PEZI|nr:hypothetical protein NKR23_g180 [Pleurostoma richardsiae]
MAIREATFEFLQWQTAYEQQKPYEIFLPMSTFTQNNAVPRSNLVFEPRRVPVQDVSSQRNAFDLDTHGFQIVNSPTTVDDLKDRTAVSNCYIPEMERFLQHHLGYGEKVRTYCFDLRLRESIDLGEFSKKTKNLEDGFDPLLPATHPHVDQSIPGAISRVRRHMGDEADSLLKGRVRIINIWRPLETVNAWPLAFCDGRTVQQADLVACDIVRRRYVGETYFGMYNPSQRWYYSSGLGCDDLILLKIYDSDPEVHAKNCLHASFPLGDTGTQGLRESIELRMLVFTES